MDMPGLGVRCAMPVAALAPSEGCTTGAVIGGGGTMVGGSSPVLGMAANCATGAGVVG